MKSFANFVKQFSLLFDKMAGIFLVASVALIVGNILLRAVFHRPFLGTYEIVSVFSAAMIGLSLANCAVKKGHISVSILVDKFPARLQTLVDAITSFLSLGFWGMASWHVMEHGFSLKATGVVLASTQLPFYPVVWLIGFGLFALCLVLLVQLLEDLSKLPVQALVLRRPVTTFKGIPQEGGIQR